MLCINVMCQKIRNKKGQKEKENNKNGQTKEKIKNKDKKRGKKQKANFYHSQRFDGFKRKKINSK